MNILENFSYTIEYPEIKGVKHSFLSNTKAFSCKNGSLESKNK